MTELEIVDRVLLIEALRAACQCDDVDSPPTDWGNRSSIPHHCDCVLYPFELPNARTAPTAYADAVRAYERLAAAASQRVAAVTAGTPDGP